MGKRIIFALKNKPIGNQIGLLLNIQLIEILAMGVLISVTRAANVTAFCRQTKSVPPNGQTELVLPNVCHFMNE